MDVCLLSVRGLCDELITRPEGPTDCGASHVIKKPLELEGRSPRWAAVPEMMMMIMIMMMMITVIITTVSRLELTRDFNYSVFLSFGEDHP
jgi:hypothetical protein